MFFQRIEALRGIFALLVLLLHVERMVAQDHSNTLGVITGIGGMAVDYFFVLSGFLVHHLNKPHLGQPAYLKTYYLRRLSRLIPMYWLTIAFCLLIMPFSQSWHIPPLPELLKHLFFITPDTTLPNSGRVLEVSWTLELDMLFYLMFGLVMLIKQSLIRLALILLGFVVALLYSPYFMLFISGVLVSKLIRRPIPSLFGVATLYLALFAAAYIEYSALSHTAKKIGFALSFSLTLLSMIRIEKQKGQFLFVATWLKRAGRSAYSVYLLHIPFAIMIYAVLKRTPLNEAPGWSLVLLVALPTYLLSCYVSEKVEHPLNRAIRKKLFAK